MPSNSGGPDSLFISSKPSPFANAISNMYLLTITLKFMFSISYENICCWYLCLSMDNNKHKLKTMVSSQSLFVDIY